MAPSWIMLAALGAGALLLVVVAAVVLLLLGTRK